MQTAMRACRCSPGVIHRPSLVAQLRYSGILEAVRVQRLGFPVRLAHGVALGRYRGAAAAAAARRASRAGHQKNYRTAANSTQSRVSGLEVLGLS